MLPVAGLGVTSNGSSGLPVLRYRVVSATLPPLCQLIQSLVMLASGPPGPLPSSQPRLLPTLLRVLIMPLKS